VSFLKNLKEKAKDFTGLGLNAQEEYARAYEKGVLLQKYQDAMALFERAAAKFEQDGNKGMARRARANGALYSLVNGGGHAVVPRAISALEGLDEIEHIGSQHEVVPVAPMVAELRALNREGLAQSASDRASRIEHYREASNLLMPLGNEPLQFAEYLSLTGPVSKYSSRGLYYLGFSDYHSAFASVNASPEEAHNFLQKALGSFRAAGAEEMAKKTSGYIENVKSKRHCWMCGREMQGEGLFYEYYPTDAGSYQQSLIEQLEQDTGMLDREGHVTLCTVCGQAVENQADKYATMRAQEVREWAEAEFAHVATRINDIVEEVNNINNRIRELQRAAHTHSG